jgi:hypothetical protein
VIHVLQVLVVQVPDVSVFVILVKGDSKAVGNVKDASETENYNTYKTSTGTVTIEKGLQKHVYKTLREPRMESFLTQERSLSQLYFKMSRYEYHFAATPP